MSVYTIYRVTDGTIVSHFSGPRKSLALNTPEGHAAIEGRHNPRDCVIDPQKKIAVKRERSEDELASELSVAEEAVAAAGIQILETNQSRVVREALLTLLPPGPERDRLKAIDDQIAQAFRPKIRKRE